MANKLYNTRRLKTLTVLNRVSTVCLPPSQKVLLYLPEETFAQKNANLLAPQPPSKILGF